MHGAHFGDLEQSLPLRRAQIARDGYLAFNAVEARRLAVAAVVAVLRVDLRVREVDLGAAPRPPTTGRDTVAHSSERRHDPA